MLIATHYTLSPYIAIPILVVALAARFFLRGRGRKPPRSDQ